MAWCSAKQKPKYKNLVEKSRARGFPHKELIFRLLTALLRTLIFRRSIIMANKEDHMNMKNMSAMSAKNMENKEDHMNMKNMSAKNMENNESNMCHMDHDMTETDHNQMNMDHDMAEMDHSQMNMNHGDMDMAGNDMMMHGGT
ncbi:hypothetical protein ACXO3U_09170, partial [Lactobacillus delbrueckii subsp. bulgaricus]